MTCDICHNDSCQRLSLQKAVKANRLKTDKDVMRTHQHLWQQLIEAERKCYAVSLAESIARTRGMSY